MLAFWVHSPKSGVLGLDGGHVINSPTDLNMSVLHINTWSHHLSNEGLRWMKMLSNVSCMRLIPDPANLPKDSPNGSASWDPGTTKKYVILGTQQPRV